jgi:hypothetical protein
MGGVEISVFETELQQSAGSLCVCVCAVQAKPTNSLFVWLVADVWC